MFAVPPTIPKSVTNQRVDYSTQDGNKLTVVQSGSNNNQTKQDRNKSNYAGKLLKI